MLPRPKLHLVVAVALAMGAAWGVTAADEPRNVLLIVLDDIGEDSYNDYLDRELVPEIDSLAAGGLRFTEAWANPLCSPTRATLLTGLYGFRTGVERNAGQTALANSELTIAEALTAYDSSFRSSAIGKWHLNAENDKSSCDVGPFAQGFTYYHGSYSNMQCQLNWPNPPFGQPYTSCDLSDPLDNRFDYWNYERTTCNEYLCSSPGGSACAQYDPTDPGNVHDDLTDHELARIANWSNPDLHSTVETTNAAIDWIDANSNDPWFTYVAYNAAHGPWQPVPFEPDVDGDVKCLDEDNQCKTESHELLVRHVDEQIGELIAYLEANSTLWDNTVVVIVGDNGTPGDIEDPEDFAEFGSKNTVYQGGVHVPMIISTPETRAATQSYQQSAALVNTTDIFATVLELATGESVDYFRTVEDPPHSYSLLPILDGTQTDVRDWVFAEVGQNANAKGAIRDDRFKLVLYASDDPEFYDLDAQLGPNDDTPEDPGLDLLPLDSADDATTIAAFEELCRTTSELAGAKWDTDSDGFADACCTTDAWNEDTDSDGVVDLCDVCPGTADPGQADGDGDGVGDACDNCPQVANPDQQLLTVDLELSGEFCTYLPPYLALLATLTSDHGATVTGDLSETLTCRVGGTEWVTEEESSGIDIVDGANSVSMSGNRSALCPPGAPSTLPEVVYEFTFVPETASCVAPVTGSTGPAWTTCTGPLW